MTFDHLFDEVTAWAVDTFGPKESRGPLGTLAHLKEEADEAADEWKTGLVPLAHTELADCLILIIDAAHRMGLSADGLVRAAAAKMRVNRTRVYPKPVGDEVSRHVKMG